MIDKIHNMKLHDRLVDKYRTIERVPGGWNYIYSNENGITSHYVPYSKEFDDKPKQTSIPIEPTFPELEKLIVYWNSKKIIRCNSPTVDLNKAYKNSLGKFTKDKIKEAIDNYTTVLHDQDSFFSHKWSLIKFLKQRNCIPDFIKEGEKWINYKSNKETNETKTEEEDEHTNARFAG